MLLHKKFYIIFTFIIILSLPSFSQSRKTLERRIKKYERELKLTKKLLSQTKQQKKQTYNKLVLINRQIELRQELIEELKKELTQIDNKISENEWIINSLEEDLKTIREQYARLIYFAWKNSSPYEQIMYVLAANSFNQAFMRVKYLQQISDYRKKQVEAIQAIKKELEQRSLELEQKRTQRQNVLKKLETEQQGLVQSKKEKKQTIEHLQQKEKDLLAKLKKQQKAAEQLKHRVAQLIEEEARKARERARREAAKRNAKSKNRGKTSTGKKSPTYYLTPEEKIISGKFEQNKGKLPWPVAKGIITGRFGTHEHAVLKGIKVNNNGIYISTVHGAKARAIFDGEVRKIFEVPGKHKIVLIKHGNYYSVYGNLAKVFVKEGDKVKTKQTIGEVYTDDEKQKTEIELQIWDGLKKVNPELWLAH